MSTPHAIRNLVGHARNFCLAAYDYRFKPELRDSWGGPFNGQQGRQELFRELLSTVGFQMIVETGTYRGTTTEFMAAESGVPLCTVEADSRYYYYARRRLRGRRGVHLALGDSRAALTRWAKDSTLAKRDVMFYLDAHWGDDLPLRQEVEIIIAFWTNICIIIDDFQVPGDDGYEYDDFGPGMRLSMEYLAPLERFGLATFFPARPSASETGSKRGCIVLADEAIARRLRNVRALRSA
jgi:hypothetical protein